MTGPLLDGVRIVEIAHPLTEHAGRLFAGLGAEVLLVEPPAGSATRHRLPALPDAASNDRASIAFLARNANKDSLVIDPTDPGDIDLLLALIARSDLVIDTDGSPFHDHVVAAPGDASRITITDPLGLGTSSIVGFAASGAMACSGWPDRPPVDAPSWLAADGASIYAAMMGAVALFVQHRHGLRLDYEVPYHEGAVRTIAPWSRHLHSAGVNVAGQGTDPGRSGDGPYPVFATSDGWVKIAITTPRQFAALIELLGSPPELTSAEWSDREFLRTNIDLFFAICAPHFADRATYDWFHAGQQLSLTITPLNTLRQFRDDPHAEARDLFITIDDPDFGRLEMMRAPIVAEPAALVAPPAPAPGLGSANGRLPEILAEPERRLTSTGVTVDPLRPLADLRLLQLGSGAVVPEACSDFALLGADIIRVESMVYPDFLRRSGIDDDPDRSPTFNQLNLGVRSLGIDMTKPAATEIVRRLLTRCDAVVENMRAPVVENWGFDDAACRAVQPDVITLSSQGFGRGPYGRYQSFGPNLSAYTGAATQWAHPDDPVKVGTTVPHPDHVAGKQAFVALLAALRRRDAGGGGCSLEAAQIEAPAHLIADRFLAQSLIEGELAPDGNRSPDMAPHGCFPCLGDRWIAIAAETDEHWRRLTEVIAEPWTDDPALTARDGRLAAADRLDKHLAAWTASHDVTVLETALRAAGVPASRVVNSDDMATGAGNEPGGLFAEVDHPVAGRLAVAGMPVLTPSGRRPVALPSPCIGEHTDDIVHELAGYDLTTIAELRRQKVIGY